MSKKEDKKREETKKKILSEMKKEEFMKAIAKDLPEDINEQEFMQAIAEKLGDHMNINTDYDMNDDEDLDKSFAMFKTRLYSKHRLRRIQSKDGRIGTQW